MNGRMAIDGVRWVSFVTTGLAVPLYAFPVLKALGRSIDLATVLAALFVLSSLASYGRISLASWLWVAVAAVVPTLILIRPGPSAFDPSRFLVSYGHWLLLIAFFFFSFSLRASETARARIALWNVAAGTFVALIAIYQVVGTPYHWPGTGPILVHFQREPLHLTWIGGFSQEGSYTRPSSVFLEPSWMGGYLSWVFVLGVGAVPTIPRGLRSKIGPLTAVGLTFILVAIAASVSWGTYVDFAVAVGAGVVSLLFGARSLARKDLLVIAAVALIFALIAVSPLGRRVGDAVSQRWEKLMKTPLEANTVEAQRQDSTWVRVQNFAHTARLFRAHPIRGIGLGQFANFRKSGEPSRPSFTDPWCGWVAIAAEMGVLGPFLLFGALLLVLRRWRRNRFGRFGDFTVPALLAVVVIQQFHTASFVDLWWWYPMSVASVLCGLAAPAATGALRGIRDSVLYPVEFNGSSKGV